VIDSTGVPFLVTGATADGLVGEDTAAAFMMNGTVHQPPSRTSCSGRERRRPAGGC